MIESVNTMAEKTNAKALKEELFYAPKHMATVVEEDLFPKADVFAEGYKDFMSNYKTEREITAFFKAEAEKRGYTEFDKTKTYQPGDRVYRVNRNKCIILTAFGKKPLSEGLRIAASHIDSPRLDLKPNPLYEKEELAFFKTHYYGGIKKYQWTTIPLSLHGVIVKGDGTTVTVNIGEDEGDPQFVITDLLPHLAKEQEKRTLADAIKGEDLNVLVGSLPFKGEEESELVKLNILKILNEKYGIVEKDFLTAELELVPAFKARDIGFDRSLIAAYGHDDKVCSYPAAIANFEVEDPEYTVVTILTDKEEIGSDGNTGLNSSYFKYFVEDLGETSPPAWTRPTRNRWRRTTRPTSRRVSASASTLAPAASTPPRTPPRSSSAKSAGSSTSRASSGRRASSARSTRAAAERSPCTSRPWTSTSSTSARRSSPCTPPTRSSPSWTSTPPTRRCTPSSTRSNWHHGNFLEREQ